MYKNPNVGVGIIITKGNNILLVKRQSFLGPGTWSTPGGYLDFGEAPESCAAREAKEETGVAINNVRFRAITNDVFADDEKHFVTIWMEADYFAGEAKVNAADEIAEVGWYSWDDLPEPLFTPFQHLISGDCYPRPEDTTSHNSL